jgi:uncharacterized protein involved in copper resistance
LPVVATTWAAANTLQKCGHSVWPCVECASLAENLQHLQAHSLTQPPPPQKQTPDIRSTCRSDRCVKAHSKTQQHWHQALDTLKQQHPRWQRWALRCMDQPPHIVREAARSHQVKPKSAATRTTSRLQSDLSTQHHDDGMQPPIHTKFGCYLQRVLQQSNG